MKTASITIFGLLIFIGWSFSENIAAPPGYETYPNQQLAYLNQDVNLVNVGEKDVLTAGSKCYAIGVVLLIHDNYVLLNDVEMHYQIRAYFQKVPTFGIGETAIVWGKVIGYPAIPPNSQYEYQGEKRYYLGRYFADVNVEFYYSDSLGANYDLKLAKEKSKAAESSEQSNNTSEGGPAISIKDFSGNLSEIPNSRSKDLISNMADSMSYFGVQWAPLDYQAAMFSEYGNKDQFLLEGTVQQIIKNADGSFTYFCFLSNWNSAIHGFLDDFAAIISDQRVKGLDVGKNGLFYCRFTDTEYYEAASKLTNASSKVQMPTFKATLCGIGLQ